MYRNLVQNVLLPLHDRIIKGRQTSKYRAFLDDSQWWSTERLLDFQWKELKKLLTHAYEQVPYWRDVFRSVDATPADIHSYKDYLKLPVLEKAHIKSNQDAIVARNYLGKTWTKATGGSTGEPLHLHYTPDSYDWRVAISQRGYSWAGCEDGMPQVWIWGVPIGDRPLYKEWKERLHQRILGRVVFNSFKFDEHNMADCLETINRHKPSTIVGYTNPLYTFAEFVAARGGLRFRPSSVISAAEKLFEHQRLRIEETFNCPVFNTYGSREFMLIAAECERHAGLHVSAENLFVEIIGEDGRPAASGETGDILVTDLHNWGMPFIRYRIGDMAVASDANCACGRGLPLIRDVVGRRLDMIRTRDGKNVPGEFFPHLMKEFPGVTRFQVVQDDLDHLTIKIVKGENFSDRDYDVMKREIFKVFERSLAIDLQFVHDIPLTKMGKYRVTVSNLPQP